MRRALIWPLALPFAAVSVLAGHAVAYGATGAAAGARHGYLEHAPQVVAVLVLLGLVGLACDGRARSASFRPVAALAAAGFACQEHLEPLLHAGDLPFLLTSPTFWLGLALQLPFAAAVWLGARRLARTFAITVARAGPPRLATLPRISAVPALRAPVGIPVGAVPGRGPPLPS